MVLISDQRLLNTFNNLKAQEKACDQMTSRQQAFERMRDTLFDATCTCSMKHCLVTSASPQFHHYFGTASICNSKYIEPLFTIGASGDEKQRFYDLYLEALQHGKQSVCVQSLSVMAKQGGPNRVCYDVKVFMLVFLVIGKGRVEGVCVFVGFQISDDSREEVSCMPAISAVAGLMDEVRGHSNRKGNCANSSSLQFSSSSDSQSAASSLHPSDSQSCGGMRQHVPKTVRRREHSQVVKTKSRSL